MPRLSGHRFRRGSVITSLPSALQNTQVWEVKVPGPQRGRQHSGYAGAELRLHSGPRSYRVSTSLSPQIVVKRESYARPPTKVSVNDSVCNGQPQHLDPHPGPSTPWAGARCRRGTRSGLHRDQYAALSIKESSVHPGVGKKPNVSPFFSENENR